MRNKREKLWRGSSKIDCSRVSGGGGGKENVNDGGETGKIGSERRKIERRHAQGDTPQNE